MIVLDASVLIAYLNPHDVHHQDATALLLESTADELLVHAMTMAEVLVGGARVGHATAMGDSLMAIGIALTRQNDDEPLRLAELWHTTRLKLPDCCVLDCAQTAGARLATFDEALGRAAANLGIMVLPARDAARSSSIART